MCVGMIGCIRCGGARGCVRISLFSVYILCSIIVDYCFSVRDGITIHLRAKYNNTWLVFLSCIIQHEIF